MKIISFLFTVCFSLVPMREEKQLNEYKLDGFFAKEEKIKLLSAEKRENTIKS